MPPLFRISENSTCLGPVHVRPVAFRSHRCGSPPCVGTIQVSQLNRASTVVYAMRVPSGENAGVALTRAVHFQPRRNSTTVLVLNSARLFQKTRRKRSNYGKLVSRFS